MDVGRPISNIKLNINVPNLAGIIAEVIDTVVTKEQEVQDLEGRWNSMRILPYKTEDNRIAGAVLALVEIDALKRTQEALRESEGGLRSLLEEAPDFIVSADPEGRVLFLNRTVAGLAKEAAIGESIYDYLEPEDIPVMRKCLAEVRATGQVAHFETGGVGRLQAMKRYITRVGPIKSGGKIVGLTLMTAGTPANKRNQKQGRR
jgi:two-component system CheB/CheR fusion protein